MNRPHLRFHTLALICVLSVCSIACTSYKLGHNSNLGFKNLHISPVENNSYAPQAQALITKHIKQLMIQENDIQIVNESEADATLIITLTEFNRHGSSVQALDTARTRSYDISLEAECSLINNKTHANYFKNRKVAATINAFADDGLQSSEYQSMPTLTKKLAQKIRNSIVSTW